MCAAKSLAAHRGPLAVCAAGGHEHMRDVGGVVKHQAEVHDEDALRTPQHQVVILDPLPTKTGKGVCERTTVLQLS